jgi:hypothetical protein
VEVWLAALNPSVLESVRLSGLADQLGSHRMFMNARAAVRHYQHSHIGNGINDQQPGHKQPNEGLYPP